MKIIFKNIFGNLIDVSIFVILQFIVYGKLFTMMGFNPSDINSAIIGGMMIVFAVVGFNRAVDILGDLKFTRHIDFELSLPISAEWMLVRYIIGYFIFFVSYLIPIAILSACLLALQPENVSILGFSLIYLLSMLFFVVFFLMTVFALPYDTFMNNMWSRILLPLIFLAPSFYSWYDMYKILPLFSKFVLLNPYTYCSEGIKGSLFKNSDYFPTYICAIVLFAMTALMIPILFRAFKKRLDHV